MAHGTAVLPPRICQFPLHLNDSPVRSPSSLLCSVRFQCMKVMRSIQLASVALIVVGAVAQAQGSCLLHLPVCVIVIGCVMFVIAFVGCWATIKENRFFLIAVRSLTNHSLMQTCGHLWYYCNLKICNPLPIGLPFTYISDWAIWTPLQCSSSVPRFP